MKHILCFGDSNTYGADPDCGGRHPYETRWTGKLQAILGDEYRIIEEGLGGRTAVWPDPLSPNRCGIESLPMLLDSHAPLDMVVIMLGTNDLKARFGAMATDIAAGVGRLVQMVQQHAVINNQSDMKILLVAPILLGENLDLLAPYGFDEISVQKSKALACLYKVEAERLGCAFFDASQVAKPGSDQLHMVAEEHANLANAFAQEVRKLVS